MKFRVAGLLLILVAGMVPQAIAQSADLTPGARVRLRYKEGGQLTGRLLRLDSDSISVSHEDGEVTVSVDGISRLDVSQGFRRATLKGLKYGVLIGGAVGFVVGLPEAIDGGTGGIFDPGAEALPYTTLAGIGLGAIIGTGIGALSHTEVWVPVDAAPLSMLTESSAGGVRLGLVARF